MPAFKTLGAKHKAATGSAQDPSALGEIIGTLVAVPAVEPLLYSGGRSDAAAKWASGDLR